MNLALGIEPIDGNLYYVYRSFSGILFITDSPCAGELIRTFIWSSQPNDMHNTVS